MIKGGGYGCTGETGGADGELVEFSGTALVAMLSAGFEATTPTATELLAAAAFLGLYAALDQAVGAQPLLSGERR